MSSHERQQPSAGIRARLLNTAAYRWYFGTIFGLSYQAYEVIYTWRSGWSLGTELLATGLLAII